MSLPEKIYSDDLSEVWVGDSLDPEHVKHIVDDREIGALIFDAPFSEKTHSGHKNGKLTADHAAAFAKSNQSNPTAESKYSARKSAAGESGWRDIDYGHLTESDVRLFCDLWIPITNGWAVSITDDVLAPIWGKRFEELGRYRFAPLPLVETGSRVRISGDGPSSWTCWCVVSRPRNKEFSKWGTLPGAYIQTAERKFNTVKGYSRVMGGKPIDSMIEIVSDYSKQEQLVCDPVCGGGTTLVAAKMLGRRSIGIDKDIKHAKIAAKRLYETKQQAQFKFL